jgi:hypothetical protein
MEKTMKNGGLPNKMEKFPLLCLLTGGHIKNNQTHETAMCCMVCRLIEILLAKKNPKPGYVTFRAHNW